jgi:hypothetical protein
MSNTTPSGPFKVQRVAANEETTVLTPVSDGTAAIDRIPVARHKLGIAVTVVLTLLLIASVWISVHLRNVSLDWEAQVEEIKAQNYDLGARLSEEQTQVVELQSANDQLTSQLKTAQQKVLELADEKAQQGDDVEFYARQIDDLTVALSTAAGVANALDRCIEGKTQLVGYLKEAEKYDPVELEAFEASLKIKCDNAVAANVELQQLLAP